jgi:hypothetical protein
LNKEYEKELNYIIYGANYKPNRRLESLEIPRDTLQDNSLENSDIPSQSEIDNLKISQKIQPKNMEQETILASILSKNLYELKTPQTIDKVKKKNEKISQQLTNKKKS